MSVSASMQVSMGQAFLHAFTQGREARLGELTLAAKAAAPDSSTRRTFVLLGDPSLLVRPRPMAPPIPEILRGCSFSGVYRPGPPWEMIIWGLLLLAALLLRRLSPRT